ncbi:hypothetical protein NL676_009671 [Syzygium grande]|nr:hypothetical protein NL676_009671 [Syzygium grande]
MILLPPCAFHPISNAPSICSAFGKSYAIDEDPIYPISQSTSRAVWWWTRVLPFWECFDGPGGAFFIVQIPVLGRAPQSSTPTSSQKITPQSVLVALLGTGKKKASNKV